MPLQIPQRAGVVAGLQGYAREALPELDPSTSRRSFIGGLVKSVASALHDWYVALKRYADNEPFPQRASSAFLRNGWWRDVTNLAPYEAAAASGRVVIIGAAGTIIDAGTEMVGSNVTYRVEASTAIATQSLNAASLTRSGSTAIFETSSEHFLATGMTVAISGATQTDYNGSWTITVTAPNEFTFDLVDATPTTPATGSPIMTASWAIATIVSDETGQSTNLDAGSTLTISNPPSGAAAQAIVTFGEIGGGTDAETTESYRARILKALGTDFGMFTADEIEIVAKSVPGVTRVWVRKATENGTNGVYDGQVKIAFMRDDDANPYPSSFEVETVREKIHSMIMPAHTAPEDVVVAAPTKLDVDIDIASLVPDTASMRRAIIARLEQFFGESVDYATNIPHDAILCAVRETYDREGRAKVVSFTLADPASDVTVGANELPALGEVTFA